MMVYFVLLVFAAICHQSLAGITSCSYPPDISNGEYRFAESSRCSRQNGFDSSCFLQVLCNSGYFPRGGYFLYCEYNGYYFAWSESPTCEASICDASMTIKDGQVRISQYDSVTYVCNPGYTLHGNRTSQCRESGDVVGDPPICEGNPVCKDGKHPGTLLNGYGEPTSPAVDKKFRIGTVLSYTCENGHRMSGESNRRCLHSGGWSAPKPKCTAVTCEPLQDTVIENGSSDAQNRTYYEGDIIRFSCNYGYRPIGKTWRTCSRIDQNTTVWSDSTPRCQEIHCPQIATIENGNVLNQGERRPGTTVTFTCFSGYDRVGPSEATCQINGKWSGISFCNARNQQGCGNPGTPLNGYKTGTDYDRGDVVTFVCNRGYTLIGSETRLCNRTTSTWTGEQPRCKDPNEFDDIDDIIERMSNATSAISDEIEEGDNAAALGRTIDLNYKGGWNIYFIFDASNSVGKQNFELGVSFAKALVTKVGVGEIGSKGARFGAVVFASRATIVFNLNDPYNNVDAVHIALDFAKQELTKGEIGGGTGTREALQKLEQEMLRHTPQRADAKSAIFLITDGKSNEGGSPLALATTLKEDHGMFLHCIGVGADVDDEQLAKMASDPKNEHLFFMQDYSYVGDLAAAVTSSEREVGCGEGSGPFAGNVRPRGRVVGGNDASDGAWPWMVGLYKWTNKLVKPSFLCGGSLIARGWVLTAAHCFDPLPGKDKILAENLIVVAGSNERISKLERVTIPLPTDQILQVETIIEHTEFKIDADPEYDNDIALLRLREEADITSTVNTICLPEQGIAPNADLLKRGENKRPHPYVTGWGSTEALHPLDNRIILASKLQQLALPLKGTSTCRKSLSADGKVGFTERMICAGYERGDTVLQEDENAEEEEAEVGEGKADSCKGDSGGPLVRARVVNGEDIYYQIGIVSWGEGCAQKNTYGFYTHLPLFIDWIHNKTGEFDKR